MERRIVTDRLILREWREEDRDPFARMNADPRVMRYYPSVLTRAESDAAFARFQEHFRVHGFGPFAVESRDDGGFAGYISLAVPRFEAHFTPCVEVGWRLLPEYWNRGLATEGARAVVRHAFDDLGLNELLSFTVPANIESRRVMEKLGMSHDEKDDFDHPNLADGHPLRRHVLYRLRR